MPETHKLKELPASIQNLLRHGIQLTKPQKVILFGSRARGDFRENSDYDIAFLGLASPEKWINLKADYYEEPITLLKVDLLIYEQASQEYRSNIDREGVLLYES